MGSRGPQKTVTKKLEARGSRRAKDRKSEPVYGLTSDIKSPASLGDDGTKQWNRLMPLLAGQGVLTDTDLTAFERYCFMWDLWKELTSQPNFSLASVLKIEEKLSKLEQQFGLTPASRPNIKATKIVEEEDTIQRFFQGKTA